MADEGADRLTALEAAFLHLERDGLPIHIGSVGTFEGGPLLDDDGELRLSELRAQVDRRLDELPRLRRRVVWPPLGLVAPGWVDDVDFDVANHVDAVRLPRRAGVDGLRRLAERVMAEPLPRDRPLWHLRFVTGLPGGRVGLIQRVHHALTDGVSGVDVALVLFDPSPDPEPLTASTWEPAAPLAPGALLSGGLWELAGAPVRALGSMAGAVVDPLRFVRQSAEVVTALGTVVLDGLVAPRSALNARVDGDRHLAWVSVRLDDVKRVGRRHGATANDVVLASVAHGLRALLLERGESLPSDAALKVVVPVSLRDEDHRGTLGNQVGALLLRLPIGIGDPVDRLQAVARTTARAKQRREAAAASQLLGVLDLLPQPLVARVAKGAEAQRLVNLIITNVPGPPFPLFCRGARLLEVFPVAPLGGDQTIAVAILSYDGALNVGVTADATHVPDIELLQAGIEAGFAALGATRQDTTAASG
jgi:diacylglycerol O-acyltransferase